MTITKAEVLLMDYAAITGAMKVPETNIQMQTLLRDRAVAAHVSGELLKHKQAIEAREATVNVLAGTIPPSTEELAAQAVEMIGEEPTVAEQPIVEVTTGNITNTEAEAEDAEFRENGITPHRDASGKIYKLVQEYQVRDEDGTAIGRPTHLEAKSTLELLSKQRKAHEEAVRFGYRMKKQKLQFKSDAPKPLLSAEAIQAAARAALDEKDESKATDVVREIIRSDFEQQEQALRNQIAFENGRAISNEFRSRHLHDYNPCDANKQTLNGYFKDNPDLEFTIDSLEFAFTDLTNRGKLVPIARQATTHVETVPNPNASTSAAAPTAVITAPSVAAVETAPVVDAAVPPSQAAPTATVATPAPAANVTPPARRPAVNGGLPPGALSAQRPGALSHLQTRKEFLKVILDMKPEVIKQRLRTDPQFVQQFKRHGIPIQ